MDGNPSKSINEAYDAHLTKFLQQPFSLNEFEMIYTRAISRLIHKILILQTNEVKFWKFSHHPINP